MVDRRASSGQRKEEEGAEMTDPEIKVGDKLYYIDSHQAPHIATWRTDTIIGETKVSWLLGPEWRATKVNKKSMVTATDYRGYRTRYYTKSAMEDKIFCSKHRRNLGSAVEACNSPDILRQIADLLGKKLD